MSPSTKIKNYFDRTPREWAATLVSYAVLGILGAGVLFIVGLLISALFFRPFVFWVVVGFVSIFLLFSRLEWAVDTLERMALRKRRS